MSEQKADDWRNAVESIALMAGMDPAETWGVLDILTHVREMREQISALKSTVASLLSIDDSKVAEYVVLSPEALREAAENRVAELEAKVARLEAPVSDEERQITALKNAIIEWSIDVGTGSMNHGINMLPHQVLAAILRRAARSTPPAKGDVNVTGRE